MNILTNCPSRSSILVDSAVMSWTKVSDTRWERETNYLEGYFIFMSNLTSSMCDGRIHYTLFSKVQLEADIADMESALKKAWKQIRYEQPSIATTVDGMKKVYEVPDEKALEEWMAATFIVSDAADAEALYQSAAPVQQSTLYYVPKSSEVVLRALHHTIDGVGLFLFWDSFLTALSSPAADIKFGDETSRLVPSLQEILGYKKNSNQVLAEKAVGMMMDYAGSLPGVGPVSKLGGAPPGKSQNMELAFPAKTTEALAKACKAKGITMTVAVHAAYVRTMIKYADQSAKQTEYVTQNQFNFRRYLPEPYNSNKYAAAVLYNAYPYKLALPASFDDLCKALNEHYQSAYQGGLDKLEIADYLTKVVYDVVQTPEFLAMPPSRDALVSSLGIAERYLQTEYKGIKVKDIKMGVDVVMGFSMFFIYSFQDQLRLIYSFNDGFEDPADIKKYLDEVQNTLVQEMLS